MARRKQINKNTMSSHELDRERILSLQDQELIDYYDLSISALTSVNELKAEIERRENKYYKLLAVYIISAILFFTPILFELLGLYSLVIVCLEVPIEEMYEEPEKYKREINEYEHNWINMNMTKDEKDAEVEYSVHLCIAGAICIIVLYLTPARRFLVKKHQALKVKIKTEESDILKRVDDARALMDLPPYKNAVLMFEENDVNYIAELRTILFKARACTHKEAVRMYDKLERERKEDAWREEVLKAISNGKNEKLLDGVERNTTIISNSIGIAEVLLKHVFLK